MVCILLILSLKYLKLLLHVATRNEKPTVIYSSRKLCKLNSRVINFAQLVTGRTIYYSNEHEVP